MYGVQFTFVQIAWIFVGCMFGVESVMFHLQPNAEKCLRGDLKKNHLVIGEFSVSPASFQKVNYKVRDSKGAILANGDDITKGKFTMIVEHPDVYEICFKSEVPPHQRGVPQEVSFNTKLDEEGKPLESVGEASKLKPMEVELRKLEILSQSIVLDFEEMREREIEMSNTNESTNSRVCYLSIFSMTCLICLSVWQVLYLRKYFKSRKLIE